MRNLTHNSIKTLLWGGFLIVGACCLWYFLCGNPLDELALIRRSQTVQGFIVDVWEEPPERREGKLNWSHGATYKYYLPDGREFTKSTDGSGRLKEELRPPLAQTYPVEVEYLPDAPTVSRIKGTGHDSFVEWFFYKVGLGIVLLALFTSPGIFLLRKGLRDFKRFRTVSTNTTQ